MAPRLTSPDFRAALARIVLVAFTLRALIPAGFMPSSDRPFTLSICPDGFPIELLPPAANESPTPHTHAGHAPADPAPGDSPGTESPDHRTHQFNHCAFAVSATAPWPADVAMVAPALETYAPGTLERISPSESHRFLLSQPRAPPTLA